MVSVALGTGKSQNKCGELEAWEVWRNWRWWWGGLTQVFPCVSGITGCGKRRKETRAGK